MALEEMRREDGIHDANMAVTIQLLMTLAHRIMDFNAQLFYHRIQKTALAPSSCESCVVLVATILVHKESNDVRGRLIVRL